MFHSDAMRCCETCNDSIRLIAICETPGADTQTHFYQCTNPYCRETYRMSVPVMPDREWIGLRQELEELPQGRPH